MDEIDIKEQVKSSISKVMKQYGQGEMATTVLLSIIRNKINNNLILSDLEELLDDYIELRD